MNNHNEDFSNIKYDILYDKIVYFPNILLDVDNITNIIESINSKSITPWLPWYASQNKNHQYGMKKEIMLANTKYETDINIIEQTEYVVNSIVKAFIKGIDVYAKIYNLNEEDVSFGKVNFYKKETVFGLNKYNTGSDMGPHVDKNETNQQAYFVTALYMNDNYEGGEINFIQQEVLIKPKSGSLIIFPGTDPYIHEVLQVTKGNKLIINHHINTEKHD
jgi:hypothetical protein